MSQDTEAEAGSVSGSLLLSVEVPLALSDECPMPLPLAAESLDQLDAFCIPINHAKIAASHHMPLAMQLD